MKIYNTKEIRNISLLGNAGSGKTTMAESMLFIGGNINRKGDIGNKNTVSDYHEIEHEQEGSVYSTVLYTEWNGNKINIIDCPGLDDFIGGAVSSLKVTDSAVITLNAQNGAEVGAEVAFRHAESNNKPVIFAVNHLDHEKTNFDKTIEDARQKFGNKVIITQYPINAGPGFDSIVDIIKMKLYTFTEEGKPPKESDIPADEQDKAAELQEKLIEAAAENDEELMELFFDKGTLDENEMRKGLQIGFSGRGLFPLFCINAKTGFGLRRLMDFIVNVVPSPDAVPKYTTTNGEEITCDANAATSLFVFKNSVEAHLGEVLFFRVISGEVKESDDLINVDRQAKERLSQLFVVSGKNRTKVEKIVAGDIGATVKLKETKVNHNLNQKDADWKIHPIEWPEPKYRTAVKAVNESDDEKLGESLSRLHDEDPTLVIEYSKELKQLIVHGQGEFHLNTLKWHLENTFHIEIEFLPPKIPYRETITKAANAVYRHKKQSGGAGQFGEVHMVIEPYKEDAPDPKTYKFPDKEITVNVRGKEEIDLQWGGKLVFYNCIVGGVIDSRFMPAILKGIMEKMEEGPLTGCYARDIRVAVYDGKMHPVDSNEISFKLAGLNAFKSAFKEAGPKIMEPIYKVEVLVPSDRMGDVMSDLQGRRALIEGMSSEKGFEKISAKVPLAEMNKYSTSLSSLTNGRAMFSMKFDQYSQVPGDVQEKLLKEYEESQKEE